MNIEELYRTYFDIVYRYIRSVSRDGALAEEVTQETFFKALKKADQFRDDCDVRVWLCQIAKNTFRNRIKKFFPCGHSESLSLVRSEYFLEKVKTGRG